MRWVRDTDEGVYCADSFQVSTRAPPVSGVLQPLISTDVLKPCVAGLHCKPVRHWKRAVRVRHIRSLWRNRSFHFLGEVFTVPPQESECFKIAEIYLKHINSTFERKVIFFYPKGLLRLYFTTIWKLIVTIKAMITSPLCCPTVTISFQLLDHLFTRTLSVSTVLTCTGNGLLSDWLWTQRTQHPFLYWLRIMYTW